MSESNELIYWVLKEANPSDCAVIDALPEGSPAKWRFKKGLPLADEFPSDPTVRFAKAYSDGIRLYDVLSTDLDVWFVSNRLKAVFEEQGVANSEFLPITVLDHKGKVASDTYFIMNILGSQPAIDMAASRCTMSSISEDQVKFIERLSLDHDGIDPGARIFRASTMLRLILIRDDLRLAIEGAGLTGYKVYAADGWDGREMV